MEGMTHEQIVCAGVSLLETIVACALMQVADTPRLVALCSVAMLCGIVAFWLSIGED